jgi:predicted ABC-type exoprotein transport system permease subunit
MHLPKFNLSFRIPLIPANVLVSVVCIPLILFISGDTEVYKYIGLLPVIFKLVMVMIVLILTYNLLDAFPNGLVFRYLNKYKAYSFFLFAVHTFIFSLVQRPLFKRVENHLMNQYFTLGFSLITLVIVLVISITLGIFIKNKFPKFFGLITGR